MFTIRTHNAISPAGLGVFDASLYSVSNQGDSPDALLLRSAKLSPDMIPSSVKAVARAGAGVNNIPVDSCTEQGVVVFNTPGANANSVKELAIAGMLLSARAIHEGINWVGTQEADSELPGKVEKGKSSFAGSEIQGKRLGVVGLGAIGVQVANAAEALGMEVHGYDPFISVKAAWGLSSSVRRCNSIERLLEICDYVSLHLPLTPDTKDLVDGKKLSGAKKGLRLLNFSRGALANNTAVLEALDSGRLSRYVTDFPSQELLGHPGVLCIPHLGASTSEAEDNCAVMAAKQLRDFIEDGTIKNSVNFPACHLERNGGGRILVANKNIPNMLTQILGVLSARELNVENMTNRHRDSVAYNIIDVCVPEVDQDILDALKAIEGVLMVRHIPAQS
ncbi:MAG: 3-phosphoglycerate dehydrogenase family protein [Spirochaetales bacterium]|nr:3-phosphoglycerate dehydrogenase family protein [Spirochaetales bacterium]